MPPPAPAAEPDTIDYRPLSFYPDRWDGVDANMTVFAGEHVVFLALAARGPYDADVMRYLLGRLDSGWASYAALLGCPPPAPRRPSATVRGLAGIVAAVPDGKLSCGYGCGYVGVAGIEVAGFYGRDYPRMCAQKKSGELRKLEHYFYYEMGRNFYVFGRRHIAFRTGFAVFMRYVVMDVCGCADNEPETRKAIEKCESAFADLKEAGELGFVDAMTSGGELDEKDDRIPGLSPSDQACMYASAQLYLLREYGLHFLKRFYAALQSLPAKFDERPRAQCLSWMVCASVGARLLTKEFVSRWGLALSACETEILQKIDWTADPKLCIEQVLKSNFFDEDFAEPAMTEMLSAIE